MISSLFIIPAFAGCLSFFVRRDNTRRWIPPITGCLYIVIVAIFWLYPESKIDSSSWLRLDSASILFAGTTGVLFTLVTLHLVGYLRLHSSKPTLIWFSREAIFTGCLLLFLSTMSLVFICDHVGLLWVAIEGTTLVSAPLICYQRNAKSLEATWKYLMICSIGIALALIGNFLVAFSASEMSPTPNLTFTALADCAPELSPIWLKAAFIFLLVGYGTKMGLAPLHTWLPDAHSEAPSPVSALLSGALLNCAFLGILRINNVIVKAGLGEFSRQHLIFFGVLSLFVAGIFILRQADYKRMLAYSSVEHMGVLSLAAGVGGLAGVGAMLYVINHSLLKGMLFLTAGNILAKFKSKSTQAVSSLSHTLPMSGALWFVGFLALTGAPPFGMFVSELLILKGMADAKHWLLMATFLTGISIAAIGLLGIFIKMTFGDATLQSPSPLPPSRGEDSLSILPPFLLGALSILIGTCLSKSLYNLLTQAAISLGVS